MKPTQPTPFETAQWILQAHVENMFSQMSDSEHADYMSNLEIVCEEMDAAALRQALGAAVDIAQEFSRELADSGVEPDRVLELVSKGRGRLHVTAGLPKHPSIVGSAAAFRLAATVARTTLWSHNVEGCEDEDSLDAYDADWEESAAAIARRSLGDLVLTGHYLHDFSRTLTVAGAVTGADAGRCPSRDGAGCRGHIDDWSTVIQAQSQALCARTGSMDRAWVLHKEFFDSRA
jgi:hypothetical protein